MADGISFNFEEVDRLAADLGRVPDNAGPRLRQAIEVTARKVKDAANASVAGSTSFWWSHLAGTIDYDVEGSAGVGGSTLEAEIGYNKSRSGSAKFGAMREFGAPGATNALAPNNDLRNALAENQADFVDGVSKALRQSEAEAGL